MATSDYCASDEDIDAKVARNPELFAAQPSRARKLYAFDWAAGFAAPFVETNALTIKAILKTVGALHARKQSCMRLAAPFRVRKNCRRVHTRR